MIDICVVNYNTRPLLQRFLNTLTSDYIPEAWNLYLADNGSTDDSNEWIMKHIDSYPYTEYFKNSNIGYSSAVNNLASNGSSEIVGIFNADVWLKTEDIIAIDNFFSDNSNAHIVGPKQRDENGLITHAGIFGTNTSPSMRGWREHDPADIMYRDIAECVTVSGSAYFVRRDVWEDMTNNSKYKELFPSAVGAFLPTPHYYEETWCSYFARHLGYNVVYNGEVSIGHSWHKSSPIGGEADKKFIISQKIFRDTCDAFGIDRD